MSSVSIRSRGERYEVRWRDSVDPKTGKVRHRSQTFARSKDAKDFAATVRKSLADGSYVAPTSQTVGEFMAEWLQAKRSQLRESTWHGYSEKVRVHVEPNIGAVPLSELDAGHLQALYAQLLAGGRQPHADGRPSVVAEYAMGRRADGATWQAIADELNDTMPEHGPFSRHAVAALVRRAKAKQDDVGERRPGLAPRSVASVHVIVKAALKDAVRWRRIVRNPADLVDPPKQTARQELRTWSADELAEFLSACEQDDDRLYALWHLLATTGMRRGEALGLRWRNVDLDAGQLVVVESLSMAGKQVVVAEPKTNAGRRVVALDADTVAVLRRHRARQASEQLLIGSGWLGDGHVFTMVDGRTLHPERTSREFVRRVERHGLPRLSLHGLRHTWATLAMAANVPARVVQERLGHSHVSVTLAVYSHVQPGQDADAAELVAGLLRRS